MIKKMMWLLAATVAALFIMVRYARSGQEPVQISWVRAQVFDARDTLKLRGTVREKCRTKLVPARDLIVRRLLVTAGETVTAGQLLAVLECTDRVPEPAEAVFRAVSALDLTELSDGTHASTSYLDGTPGEVLYLTSPISGILLDCTLEEGAVAAAYGDRLTLADMSQVYVDVQVSEENIPYLKQDMDCLVAVEALGLAGLTGSLQRIEPYAAPAASLSQASETKVGIRILLEDGAGLKPGYTAQAVFTTADHKDVMAVPYSCLGQDQSGEYLLVLRDGQICRQPVTTGQEYQEGVQVLEGIGKLDRILDTPDLGLVGKPVTLS